MICIHEGAGSVVDGLACYRHVVGVHDPMDKADKQPLRDKGCLVRNHLIKKGAIGVRGACRLWVMPRDDVISEAPDRIDVATRCEKLEGADPDVARCDASQNSAGQIRFAQNQLELSEPRAPP
jgi:hypothetical protein